MNPALIAAAAATANRLTPVLSSASTTELLASNTKSFWKLQLYKAPDETFDELNEFLEAIGKNISVTTVEITWRFLRNLSESNRVLILEALGKLQSLTTMYIEAVGPNLILSVALRNATHLKSLSIGKIRFATNQDVLQLATALRECKQLQQLSLSSLQVIVPGRHITINQGMVWFQESQQSDAEDNVIILDPLLDSIATLPKLEHIRLKHYLNGDKIQPPSSKSLCSLCRSPRKSLIFNSCGLLDDQCIAIAGELACNTSQLSVLVVTRNSRMTNRGWDAFVKMLETNYTIVDFHSGDEGQKSEPSQEQKKHIAYLLKLNVAGRGKLLDPTGNTKRCDWIDFMIRGNGDIDLLYFALQTNPSLCQVLRTPM